MDSETPLLSTGSMAATRTIHRRRRPLQTCGASIVEISRNLSNKAQEIKDPIGIMMNRLVTLAKSTSLFIFIMQFQWLAFLSFIDDHILAIEYKIETIVPLSSYVFDKIDMLVRMAESLPGQIDKIPAFVRRFPILNWALGHLISWLNFLISIWISCGSESMREKDIMVDINCNDGNNRSASIGEAEDRSVDSPAKKNDEKMEKCTYKEMLESNSFKEGIATKVSYKEVLEKAKSEEGSEHGSSPARTNESPPHRIAIAENPYPEENNEKAALKTEVMEEGENEGNEGVVSDDPILELFESAWHMEPGRRDKVSSMSSSISFA